MEIGIKEYAAIEQGTNLSCFLKFDSEEDEIVIFDGTKVSGEIWEIGSDRYPDCRKRQRNS